VKYSGLLFSAHIFSGRVFSGQVSLDALVEVFSGSHIRQS
jgi:hypothetical protein